MATALDRPTTRETAPRGAPTGRSRRPAAVSLAVVAVAMAAGAGVFDGQDLATAALRASIVATWAVGGAIVTARRPGERLGTLMLGGAALGGLASLAAAAADAGTAEDVARLALALSVASLPAVGLDLLTGLPDGRCRYGRAIPVPGYITGLAVGLLLWTQRPGLPLWPVAIEASLAILVGVIASNRRYRRSGGLERQRMQWFGWAFAIGVEIVVLALAARLLGGWPRDGFVVLAVASFPLPLALVVGTSPRLLGRVDRLLAHTVSLAGLTGVVVVVYLVIVLGLGRVPNDRDRGLLGLSMLAAGVAALLYLPARDRLARFANRLVYGEREAPDEVVRTFGSRLSRAVPLDELLLQVAESLRKSMGLSSAEIWTGAEGRLERTVSVPDAPPARMTVTADEESVVARAGVSGPAWAQIWLPALLSGREGAWLRVAPATHSGRLLGLIVAARPETDEAFRPEDDTVLAELARQVGLALHNVALDSALQESLDEVRRQANELQASRARIVAASDAARRQIERNLHDGAQQHLVALAVNLRLARQIADADPDAAKELLDQLASDLQDAVQQLRDLAHGIYPPLLMDRGLTEALAAAAGRAAIPTAVHAQPLRRYPPEVEAAVYFCCMEALQNAAKHAGDGARVEVRVWEEAGGLLFEVADDGAGFDPAARSTPGAGFVNMGDRVGAIGGSLAVESAPGKGTKVSGRIPTAAS